jgi:hypothetical protein
VAVTTSTAVAVLGDNILGILPENDGIERDPIF